MNSGSGKRIRLRRLFDGSSGRTIIIAYAHGLLMGPGGGMRSVSEIRAKLPALSAAQGVMITPGLTQYSEEFFAQRSAPSMVMLLDWQNISRFADQIGYAQGVVELAASVEQAAALGAEAVMTYLYLGNDDPQVEAQEVRRNVAVGQECERLGLVHIVESRSLRAELTSRGTYRADIVALHTRIAAELGADIVKTKYTGDVDSFASIVETALVPVVIAGGKMTADISEALATAKDAVTAGGAGLMFGRNIYQRPDAARALAQFGEVVHGAASKTSSK